MREYLFHLRVHLPRPSPPPPPRVPPMDFVVVAGEEGGSPMERSLCPGLPKAILWADVARQFTPISVSVSDALIQPPSPVLSASLRSRAVV